MSINTQIKLVQRPVGLPEATDFIIEQNSVPVPADGQMLIKTLYISLDPAMRGWMKDRRSYMPPVALGEVMRAGTIGEVIESKLDGFEAGDIVSSFNGVQTYGLSDGTGVYKVDSELAPLPAYLGALGMPGFTAYFGLLRIGEPKEGNTVLVSGGAGAVGSVVGQIAKIHGCRVVGIAGSTEKCRYMTQELDFDAAINYKEDDIRQSIKTHCPDGIDIYFDNVGGEILDIALTRLSRGARIVICGAISQYNNTGPTQGPSNYMALLVSRARMEGFLVFDYAKEYGAAARQLGQWRAEGKLKTKEYVVKGIENFQPTLLRLFSGDKLGKLVLKV